MSFFTTRFTPQFDSATCIRYRVANVEEEYMRKKLSRRDFARTSVAAGTAAVVAPVRCSARALRLAGRLRLQGPPRRGIFV